MRNGTKRFLSWMTAVAMVCSLVVMPAAAEENGGPVIDDSASFGPEDSKVTVETKRDGSVVSTVRNKDGSVGVTVTDASG